MRFDASTADTPLASSLTSAIGPNMKFGAAIHRPGAGEIAAAEPDDAPLSFHRRLAGIADLRADTAIEQRALAERLRPLGRFGIDHHADDGALRAISARRSPTVSE